MTAAEAQKRLRELANPAVARISASFFKTGAGQYGAGDVFLGIRTQPLRKLARAYQALPLKEVEALLRSPIHEDRSLALMILVFAAAADDKAKQKEVYTFYLDNTRYVNNWDLVDGSAPQLVGAYLLDKSRRPLYRLAKSASLWERRIAIVATQHFIRCDDFADTLTISKMLFGDPEDLIHKASGWMLREVGKRHAPTLERFLKDHHAAMPRTALRYAIERFPPAVRKAFLAGTFT
jgi:3-methyladenine DNA glycosylase AlkD